jgi:selenocysteine lyase/cysteine desulfurase
VRSSPPRWTGHRLRRSRPRRAGINVTTTIPEDTQFDTEDRGVHPLVRLSPHYYNTEDELDRAVEVVASLGR